MSETDDTDFKLDFGAGNVVVLLSRCLRIAKEPTDCDLCAEACPAAAITLKELKGESVETKSETPDDGEKPRSNPKTNLEKKMGVEISEDCFHCGLCTTACPVESLSTTKHHPKGVEKQITDKAAKLEGLALGCARALFGVPSRLASRAVTVPCLASLSTEMWFYAATKARDALFHASADDRDDSDEPEYIDTLKVFLPPMICSDCPVNLCGDAEKAYLAAIARIEAWGVDNIELISEPEELDPLHSGGLLSTFSDASSGGKREAVEHLASSLRRSWKSAGDDLSLEKKRTEYLAKKRKQNVKRPPTDHNAPRPFGKKSAHRRLLRLALEQQKNLLTDVELLCTSTIAVHCKGCGACVDACSLDARRKIASSSVLYFGKLPEEERPKDKMAAITDRLCCLGCSACVMQCPTGACILDDLSGSEFLNLRQS